VLAFASVSRSLGVTKNLLQEKGLFFELLNISSIVDFFSPCLFLLLFVKVAPAPVVWTFFRLKQSVK